jgi:hypothetical protein
VCLQSCFFGRLLWYLVQCVRHASAPRGGEIGIVTATVCSAYMLLVSSRHEFNFRASHDAPQATEATSLGWLLAILILDLLANVLGAACNVSAIFLYDRA